MADDLVWAPFAHAAVLPKQKEKKGKGGRGNKEEDCTGPKGYDEPTNRHSPRMYPTGSRRRTFQGSYRVTGSHDSTPLFLARFISPLILLCPFPFPFNPLPFQIPEKKYERNPLKISSESMKGFNLVLTIYIRKYVTTSIYLRDLIGYYLL